MKQIWFIDFPTFQYKEDIKKLAREKNLKIVDSKFKKHYKEEDMAKEVPKLTKYSAKQLAEETK